MAYAHAVGTLIPRLLAGRKCACLFLGQSGSGKTHAAFGSYGVLSDFHSRGEEEWGAAPRASRQLFDTLGETVGAAGPLELAISWYEVRGTHVTDLLAASSPAVGGKGEDGRKLPASTGEAEADGTDEATAKKAVKKFPASSSLHGTL